MIHICVDTQIDEKYIISGDYPKQKISLIKELTSDVDADYLAVLLLKCGLKIHICMWKQSIF